MKILFLLSAMALGAIFLSPPSKLNPDMKIISHRGAAGLAPENTIPAIQAGLEAGAPFIEIDIHRSADGHLIVMHDDKVSRTTDGKGHIRELTLAQLKQFRISEATKQGETTLTIPTLDEVLPLFENTASKLVIEVKDPDKYPGIGKDLLGLLRAKNALQACMAISFDTAFIDSLSAEQPELATGHLYLTPPKKVTSTSLISIHYMSSVLYKKRIKRLQQEGVKVWMWTVNGKGTFNTFVYKGADGIVTDHPNKFDALIKERMEKQE